MWRSHDDQRKVRLDHAVALDADEAHDFAIIASDERRHAGSGTGLMRPFGIIRVGRPTFGRAERYDSVHEASLVGDYLHAATVPSTLDVRP